MKLSQIDLNLLVALDAIIKERSVTRAGKNVGLSQPAMSAALSRLRNLLGDPLLERVGRDYRLTPLAVQLAEPVQDILAYIEHTLDQKSSFDPATAQRVFRIAGSDFVTATVFQPLVAHVSRIAPGVQLRFQRAGNNTARKLASRDIDLSVQPAGSHREFASQHLFGDRFVCAISTGNTEVADALSEAQFCQLGHISYSHPPYGFTLLDHFAGPITRNLRIQAMTDSFLDLPFLLRGTNLIALVQERLGRQLEAAADIRLVDCPVKLSPLNISMWWNALYEKDFGHAWLRATIVEVATKGAANTREAAAQ
ncbi:MAG TPA: LysR family transcriptional regulator [Polyangiales bacterium]|nr:LysR family transcriptional regulator [Polyangiales bacterium]